METNDKHKNDVLKQKQDAENQIAQILYDLEFNTGMKVEEVEYTVKYHQSIDVRTTHASPIAKIKLTLQYKKSIHIFTDVDGTNY